MQPGRRRGRDRFATIDELREDPLEPSLQFQGCGVPAATADQRRAAMDKLRCLLLLLLAC